MTTMASQAQAKARECLSCPRGTEEYGIDILKVGEIRRYETLTKTADSPDFLKGVINLRGLVAAPRRPAHQVHPDRVSYKQFTLAIVLNITRRVIGMVVGGVSEVTALSPEQIRPAPEPGSKLATQYIPGIRDQRMIIVPDIELCGLDVALCKQAAA